MLLCGCAVVLVCWCVDALLYKHTGCIAEQRVVRTTHIQIRKNTYNHADYTHHGTQHPTRVTGALARGSLCELRATRLLLQLLLVSRTTAPGCIGLHVHGGRYAGASIAFSQDSVANATVDAAHHKPHLTDKQTTYKRCLHVTEMALAASASLRVIISGEKQTCAGVRLMSAPGMHECARNSDGSYDSAVLQSRLRGLYLFFVVAIHST